MKVDIPAFNQASVLVVGDIMLDRYWYGPTQRISPEAPVPVVKINNNDERPGGAGNVALNLASLGGKVTLAGITGEDEAATTLHHPFAGHGYPMPFQPPSAGADHYQAQSAEPQSAIDSSGF